MQADEEISPELDITELSDFIINSWEGALLLMIVRGNISPVLNFKKTVLETILPGNFDAKKSTEKKELT